MPTDDDPCEAATWVGRRFCRPELKGLERALHDPTCAGGIGALAGHVDPIRKLRSELERGVSRAWEGLTEGWRELLTRSSGALTQFVVGTKRGRGPGSSKNHPTWALLAGECWETARSVIVRIELPGMSKEDIDISVDRGCLQIRGYKRSSGDEEPRHYHLMERAFGRFERLIPLPPNIDAGHAEVSYQDGVITVILPKTEVTPPTQLSIN
jgi:HSP20 family protein